MIVLISEQNDPTLKRIPPIAVTTGPAPLVTVTGLDLEVDLKRGG